ncbi:MAG: DUF968 domain-containing protein [Phycisphaerae bacterium]
MMIDKIKPYRSKRYLDWVRDRPCVHCRRPPPSEAHHVIGLAGGSMGGKAGDQLAVPLCTECHRRLHDGQMPLDSQTVWLIRTLEAAFHHGALQEGIA